MTKTDKVVYKALATAAEIVKNPDLLELTQAHYDVVDAMLNLTREDGHIDIIVPEVVAGIIAKLGPDSIKLRSPEAVVKLQTALTKIRELRMKNESKRVPATRSHHRKFKTDGAGQS